MRDKVLCIVLTALLVLSLAGTAMADHLSGKDNWSVTFTEAEKLESNFSKDAYADEVKQLQPGDDITFTVNLDNKNPHTVDWYMSNKVLSSLEDRDADAEGGGYSYKLTYDGPNNSLVLYDSETVGGDTTGQGALEGMKSATDALDEFLYLDTLSTGDSGVVTLVVGLDGETQGNAYMTTLADLKMNFAVELDTSAPADNPSSTPENPENPTNSTNPTATNPTNSSSSSPSPTSGSTGSSSSSSTPRDVVRTGDNNNLVIYFAIMGASGILFLILAIDSLRRRRKEKKEDAK